MVYTLRFFPLQNAVCFIILTYLVPVLFTFYIQGVLKLKNNNSGAKRLTNVSNAKIRKQAFVSRVIKKKNLLTDSPISNAGQGKYIKVH